MKHNLSVYSSLTPQSESDCAKSQLITDPDNASLSTTFVIYAHK